MKNTRASRCDEGLDVVKNIKRVNHIYLSGLALGGSELGLEDSDKALISTIASLCPLEAGYAVYHARAIKALWSFDVYTDDSLCTISKSYKKYIAPESYHSPAAKKQTVRIYPNPASDVIYIRAGYDPNEVYQFTMVDIEGRVVRSESLVFSQSTLTYNIAGLNFGLYFVRLQKDGETVYSDKINIVR